MKLTLLLPAKPDERWTIARQVGVRYAVTKAAPQLSGLNAPDDFDALRQVKARFADAGFELAALEGDQFDMTRIKCGLPGRDEDIERYRRMLANMGQLGITLLCYNFMPRPLRAEHDWHRTAVNVPARGGSTTTRFDRAELPPEPPEPELTTEQLWDNYEYFIRAVVPAAEAAGVTMGLHPDDPPVPTLQGVARLFGRPENFDRAMALAPSPSNCVTFCQANLRLMLARDGEANVEQRLEYLIRKWADARKLAYVHARDVDGTADRFTETWHDAGPTDMPRILRAYRDAGFDGLIRDDHVPAMHDETCDVPGYGALGHLFAMGYLKGIMHALRIPLE